MAGLDPPLPQPIDPPIRSKEAAHGGRPLPLAAGFPNTTEPTRGGWAVNRNRSQGRHVPRRTLIGGALITSALLAVGVVALGGFIPNTRFSSQYASGQYLEDGGHIGVTADFEPCEALVVGGSELVVRNPGLLAELVEKVAGKTPILCLVSNPHHMLRLQERLQRRGVTPGAVDFAQLPYQSRWVRDFGPLFVRQADGSLGIVDPHFSRPGREREDHLPRYLAGYFRLPLTEMPLVLEGGNLLSNGCGLYISTHRVAARNQGEGHSVRAMQQLMRDYCEVQQWVGVKPLVGEPTGHIDIFAAFVAPDLAVVAALDPAADAENAARLDEAARRLAGLETPAGPLRVARVPMGDCSDGVWRTYTNVLFCNGTLLVPQYARASAATDRRALEVYRHLLPTWDVVGIDCEEIIADGGSLHCLAIQVPQLPPGDPLHLTWSASIPPIAWKHGARRAMTVPAG